MLRHPKHQAFAVGLVLIVGIGVAFYSVAEGWTVIDSFYFTVIALTTVGFGDFVPTNEATGNTHFVKIEFSFLQGDPEEAEFELVLRSGGNDKFEDFPNIKKKNKTRERNFQFKVQEG